MTNISFSFDTESGWLEDDFDQLKELLETGGTTAVVFDVVTLKINGSSISATAAELSYVSGVTSAIQTQLNTKAIITGTPANNQLAVWTNSTTVEGSANFTFDGSEVYANVDMAVASGKKFIFDGSGGNSYLIYNAGKVELWVDGVKKADWG